MQIWALHLYWKRDSDTCVFLWILRTLNVYAASHISIFVRNASKWSKKMTSSPTPCHMRHSQNLGKIDSFLKPVLNTFIFCILIVGWGRGLLKRGLVFVSDLGDVLIVGRSIIHQSKSWYYLGPFQPSKVERFATSNKHFWCFVSEHLASWKKSM